MVVITSGQFTRPSCPRQTNTGGGMGTTLWDGNKAGFRVQAFQPDPKGGCLHHVALLGINNVRWAVIVCLIRHACQAAAAAAQAAEVAACARAC